MTSSSSPNASAPTPSATNAADLRLSAEEVRLQRARGESVIALDVRTGAAREFQPEQIPDSRWIPLPGVVSQSNTLPRQSTIITYCT